MSTPDEPAVPDTDRALAEFLAAALRERYGDDVRIDTRTSRSTVNLQVVMPTGVFAVTVVKLRDS